MILPKTSINRHPFIFLFMSQEFPQKSSELRDPSAESREAFLNRPSLRHLNLILGTMFKYIDDHKLKEQLEEGEIAEVKRSIEHQVKNPQPGIAPPRPGAFREFRKQTLSNLYAPNTLANILTQQAETESRSLTSYEESDITDYTQFYDIFTNHPELRVRLLEKMLTVVYGRLAVSVENRNAFGRFLYEFYGTEEKNEGTAEYFLSLNAQTDLLEAWNSVDQWGFTKEQFTDIRRQIPKIRKQGRRYADQPFIASVVTPRLRDLVQGTKQRPITVAGVGRTFGALIAVAESLRGEISGFMGKRPAPYWYGVGLTDGTSFQSGLDIGFVDLGSRGGRLTEYPAELRTPEYRRSDFRSLAAFAMCPRWIDAKDSRQAGDLVMNNFEFIDSGMREGMREHLTLAVGLSRTSPGMHQYVTVSRNFIDNFDVRCTFAEDLD